MSRIAKVRGPRRSPGRRRRRRTDQGDGEHHFAPPTLKTVVLPRRASERGALRSALALQEIYVSFYGEAQKEVVQATPADGFGLATAPRSAPRSGCASR